MRARSPKSDVTGAAADGGERFLPRIWRSVAAWISVVVVLIGGCGRSDTANDQSSWPPRTLSAFGLFKGNGSTQQPVEGVIPYDVNSPLFSDYASKHRFIKLPAGTSAEYDATDVFHFPVGTIIIKTFAMPADMTDPASPERLLETRLLVHREDGWVGLPYVWNEEQNEAILRPAGGTVNVEWVHYDGSKRHNDYLIPNMNQCKGCHKVGRQMVPIGPKARNLNRDFAYAHGTENQLDYWTRIGALRGAPSADEAPKLPVWNDPSTGTVAERARAWLEINCAHCHRPGGAADNAGINLMASQSDPVKYGVLKSPAAAGLGSGGLAYDIVPGKPDESILVHRIESTEPQVMMPELGKRLVHDEGVALVREWIATMNDKGG